MTKKTSKKSAAKAVSPIVKTYIKDIDTLSKLTTSKKYSQIHVDEYPFDAQLLNASQLYRKSRQGYLALDGRYLPKVSSMMRSLSAQDLFKNEIDYTPLMSELIWFKDHSNEVADPLAQVKSLKYFNENSLYHEQNHRVVWKLLPPAPKDKAGLRRYLNFAESLVVTLDLALGDELEKKSLVFERMGIVFRPNGDDGYSKKSKSIYRQYLLSCLCATYYALELIEKRDILKAVDYIFPKQKALNKAAVKRALELSELFTLNTNPQWQDLNWQDCVKKLTQMHKGSADQPFAIAADPLDLNIEFAVARAILDRFGL